MTLLEKYIIARWCYAIGEDFIDDIEYKYIEEQLRKKGLAQDYLGISWSDDPCPIEILQKYDLMEFWRDIKFSHKSESIRSINSEEEFLTQFSTLKEKTRVSYKIDGFNIQANYFNGGFISAETRGRTGNSLNASVVSEILPKRIPYKGKIKITGELSIPKDRWKLYSLETGNTSQRNSVSTVLARGDTEYMSYLAFNIQTEREEIFQDIYNVLEQLGFQTPMCIYVNSFSGLNQAVIELGDHNRHYNYLTDGLVVENKNLQVAVRIREWKEKVLQSYITGYSENRGIYGDNIVADIRPILVDGARRSKVSVTNLQYLIDYNLRIGSPIAFDLRSAVNCVLNTTKTKDLHSEYNGRFEAFREMIDN